AHEMASEPVPGRERALEVHGGTCRKSAQGRAAHGLGGDVGFEAVRHHPLDREAHAVHGDRLTERERRERRDDSEAETAPGARALADAAPRLDDAREHAPVIARRETTVRTPPPACERLALLRGSKGGTPSRRARVPGNAGADAAARLRATRAPEGIEGGHSLAPRSPLFHPRSPRFFRSAAGPACSRSTKATCGSSTVTGWTSTWTWCPRIGSS